MADVSQVKIGNTVYNIKDAVARGLIPDYSEVDQDSVLAKQYSGNLGWSRVENLMPSDQLLPSYGGASVGDVLTVQYDDKMGNYIGWVAPSGGSGLPDVTSSDNGKVLTAYYDDKMGSGSVYWGRLSAPSMQKLQIDKSSLSYDDKSAAYTYYMGDYEIPVSNVINVRTYNGDAKYKNITYNIREWNSICYVLYFDSTEYSELSSYVEIIYYT